MQRGGRKDIGRTQLVPKNPRSPADRNHAMWGLAPETPNHDNHYEMPEVNNGRKLNQFVTIIIIMMMIIKTFVSHNGCLIIHQVSLIDAQKSIPDDLLGSSINEDGDNRSRSCPFGPAAAAEFLQRILAQTVKTIRLSCYIQR